MKTNEDEDHSSAGVSSVKAGSNFKTANWDSLHTVGSCSCGEIQNRAMTLTVCSF